ncbi:MAG TPA: patatin-like phospholipase family protein, partial [Ideonella sp.]|nr:patatin-like phospholipase family protein [Ideonella sp.]
WGVLDRLLADPRFGVDAISGTSAGALNAAVLASGWARAGRDGARTALADFWRDVGEHGASFAAWLAAADAGRWLRPPSPYDFNPLNVNPLREVVERHVDTRALRDGPIRLHVCATEVASGRPRIFGNADLGVDALLASACLPLLFQAVEIDGAAYWDGGYSGNPALWPLLDGGRDLDLVLVKINPLRRNATPRRAADIVERAGEIGFNAPLLAELRALAAARRRRRFGRDAQRLHLIADEEALGALPSASRLDSSRAFVQRLAALGREAASAWTERHAASVGVRSTLDIEAVFFPP